MKRKDIPFYRSVTGKIFFVLLIATTMAALVTVSYVYVNTKNLLQEQSLKDIRSSTEIISKEVDTFLTNMTEEVQLVASGHTAHHFLAELNEFGFSESHPLPSVIEDLTVIRVLNSGIDEIFIANPDGIIVASSNKNWILDDISKHESNAFVRALKGELYISDPHFEQIEKSAHLTFSAPVYEKSLLESEMGELLGVVIVHVPFSNITSILTSIDTFSDEATDLQDVTLVTNNMKILYSSKESFIKREEEIVNIFHNDVLKLDREELEENHVTVINNEIISYEHINDIFNSEDRSWIVLLTVDTDSIFLPARTLALKSSLIMIPVIIVMLLIMIYVLSHIVIQPIKLLIKGAQKITEGDLSHIVESTENNEFGRLADVFNTMLAKLHNVQKVTEQKVKDRTQDLLSEKNKISYITQNMKDGTILLDSKGEVLFYNESVKRLIYDDNIDFNAGNLLQKLYKKFEGYDVEKQITTCVMGKEEKLEDINVRGKIYEIKFECLDDDDKIGGLANGKLIWIHDVTQTKLIERAKDELVSTASHQLRTPLTIVRANLEMLLSGDYGRISKAQEKVIEIIEASTIRLISLVNNMLNITKFEEDEFKLKMSRFSILNTVKTVVKNLDVEAKEKNVTVKIKGDVKGVSVYADKDLAGQVIQNLVDNAIQYSHKGGDIIIYIHKKSDTIEIKVTDSGIGIPEAEKKLMFNRFYRASNAKKIVNIGSGLGLHIAKKMVESMSGSIHLESEENVGTTVTILLPKKKQKQ